MTLAEYLPHWLATHPLDDNTQRGYEGHIRRYLIPHLGQIKVGELRIRHIRAMFAALEVRNEEILTARNSPDKTVRDSVRGQRTLSEATFHRIRATLSTAMTSAISDELAIRNPARAIRMATGDRPKARIWTPERTQAWKE